MSNAAQEAQEARVKEACELFSRMDGIDQVAIMTMVLCLSEGESLEEAAAAGNAYLIEHGREPALKL